MGEHYDILVVGKSGNGKSAVCNTLLGENAFPVGRSMSTTTTTLQYRDRRHHDATIRIIDTPDITNCGMSASEREAEVRQWKNLLASEAPSMVLVAVRCDVRFTAEEYDVYSEILRFWRADSLDRTLVVAFTFGDLQDYDIAEDVKSPPPELGQILKRAKKRHLVFTNKDGADRPAQANKCFSMLRDLQEADRTCPKCVIM
ncbi:hypothetical protein ACOMHN_066602 [Nucella lapillus]